MGCYEKCSILSYGKLKKRCSPMTCAEEECSLLNQKVGGVIPCTGYDVGDDGRCPHTEGDCYEDEALFANECLKKCSVLTDNKYPYRCDRRYAVKKTASAASIRSRPRLHSTTMLVV